MKTFFTIKRLLSDQHLLNFQQRRHRLRSLTVLFFLLLFVPISVIFYIGFMQFEKDLLIQYQRQTEKVTQPINKRIFKRAALSNGITPGEFNYYQHLYNPVNQQLSQALSPLANLEFYQGSTGIIGYFQVDQQGKYNSPVWPFIIESLEDIETTKESMTPELLKRRNIALKLFDITAQSTKLQQLIKQKLPDISKKFRLISDVPNYLIFYRVVNVNQQRKLQGYILNQDLYLYNLIVKALDTAVFANSTALTLHSNQEGSPNYYFLYRLNQQNQTEISQPKQLDQAYNQLVINSQKLYWPLSGYSITYTTSALQLTSAALYGISLMAILMAAIILGCYGFYRIGVKQLILAEQRLNFVSSVSHELKTPLTSIRMYAEMLKTGTVLSNEHKTDYYEFIHSESERLSRLIDNILQLSKLSQPQHSVSPQYIKLSILADIIRSKVSSLIENNDFQLDIILAINEPDKVMILVDIDAFSQVVINITDNAIKFFDHEKIKDKSRQKIDFTFQLDSQNKGQIILEIRDYGSGISAEQENKIFDLFYRGGSEMTRTTQGTGIGLALVNELVLAQQGSIQVKRMSPGLAMKMSFKCKLTAQGQNMN